jgi:cell volume regulation protein A
VDSSVAFFLLAVAGICLTGAFGEVVFRKTQIPDVLWLLAAGILLGPVTGTVQRAELRAMAPFLAALTLVVVLFEGGSKLKLGGLSGLGPRAGVLAILTFAASVAAVTGASLLFTAVGLLPETWTLQHGLLLGAILGGSSSVIVMPSMALSRVEPRTANLVGFESALTDALCVVGASAMLGVLSRGATNEPIWLALGRSLGIGLGIGFVSGAAWILLLRALRGSNHAYPVTLAALLALYVVIERAGGSAALGILAFAVVVGNAAAIGKSLRTSVELDLGRDVRGVHTQIAFILKSFFFTFIGAMLGPPWTLFALGGLLSLVLLLARWLSVRAALVKSGFDTARRRLVIVALPRGMAAGVLATLAAAFGSAGTDELSSLVFATVLGTILIFSIGFPWARRNAPVSEVALPLDQVPLSGPIDSGDTLSSNAGRGAQSL